MKIAIVGPGAAGKDLLSQYAADTLGLTHVSSGDIIRQYIADNNLGAPDRVKMRHVGNELRREKGPDILVRIAFEQYKDNIVMSVLRAVAEATTFKDNGGIIVAVDAPAEIRYERLRNRQDIDNTMTLEQFKERDAAEASNPDPNTPNINAVMGLADIVLMNNSDKETLFAAFQEKLKNF